MFRKIALVLAAVICAGTQQALVAHADPLAYGGFLDTYYAYDFNNIPGKERVYTTQPYINDEARVNLAMLEAKLEQSHLRGHLALQAGDSVTINYSSEPHRFFRYIQESTVGYHLSEDLWIDGGIYLSHIGFEGFNSRDNWTLARSIIADYSPYYQEGVKLSYHVDADLSTQLHILNGFQNVSDNRHPALGMQVAYMKSKDTTLTYNNFIGDEGNTRILNDFIVKTAITKATSLGVELQSGFQDVAGTASSGWWHGWGLFLHNVITPKVAVTGRLERFVDQHRIDLVSVAPQSFDTYGTSVNVDYEFLPKLFWRNEYRIFFGGNSVFPEELNKFSSTDHLLHTSLQYSFSTSN